MSIKKKHKKNKREIKTRKSIINMTEKEQTSAPETTDTNHAEAVINQTELSNKEELINQSLEPQTDQDAAPESEIETEPITVPVPTPVHSEITEDEQAKKLYDFYFGEQTQQNILESEKPKSYFLQILRTLFLTLILLLFLEIIYTMVVFLLKVIKMKKRKLLMGFMSQLFQKIYFLKFRIY